MPTPQTHSSNSSAICRRHVWMCLTILWGWLLKGPFMKAWIFCKQLFSGLWIAVLFIYIFLPSNDKKFLADSRKFFLILSIMFSVLVWRGSRWKNERNMCHVLQDPKVCTWTYKGILNLLFVHDIYTTNFVFFFISIYLFSRFSVNHVMKLHEKSRKPNSFPFFFFS